MNVEISYLWMHCLTDLRELNIVRCDALRREISENDFDLSLDLHNVNRNCANRPIPASQCHNVDSLAHYIFAVK